MFKQFPGELASSPVSEEKILWGWARSWEASKGGGLLWGGWLYFTDARQTPPSGGGGRAGRDGERFPEPCSCESRHFGQVSCPSGVLVTSSVREG